MEETRNTNTAAAAEEAIDSIKKLLDAVGNDEALKKKLEAALSALTGKTADGEEETENKSSSADEAENAEEDDTGDEEQEDAAGITSGTDRSDIFTEDALAGMVVGFIAGAAVVGGGVLIHKLIAND